MAGHETPNENQFRSSLLSVIISRTEALKRKELIHRLVYIAKWDSERSEDAIGDHYDGLFKQYGNHTQIEPPTGLLLIYPHHLIHVLEASFSVIVDVIRDLESKEKRGTIIKESKILVTVGNIPKRLYSQWYYRVLDLPAIRTDETKLAASTENLLSEALAMTLKIGSQISRVPKHVLKTTLDQLHDKYRELLIPHDIIEKLLSANELCDATQYLKKYCTPLDVTLDRDLVWPAETKLFSL